MKILLPKHGSVTHSINQRFIVTESVCLFVYLYDAHGIAIYDYVFSATFEPTANADAFLVAFPS